MKKILTIIFLSVFFFVSCKNNNRDKQLEDSVDLEALMRDTMKKIGADTLHTDSMNISVNRENSIISFSNSILEAIQEKNYDKLASFIDPNKGVIFSPYAYVDEKKLNDNHFSKQSFLKFAKSNSKKVWGYADGSGEAISMNMDEYVDKYVYDVDFLHVTNIAANRSLFKKSNGIDNSLKVFPGKTFVDYYKKPRPGENEFDWSNLRLIFNEEDGKLYLIAIVHNQWQI